MTALPPLAALMVKHGNLSQENQRLAQADYSDQRDDGDAYEFEAVIGEKFNVTIDIDLEHKDGNPEKDRIATCTTMISPCNNKRTFQLTEEAHYFPAEFGPEDQSSYLLLLLLGRQMPESMIPGLLGQPLSAVADFPEAMAMIGHRFIHEITNFDDYVLIQTVSVDGMGED